MSAMNGLKKSKIWNKGKYKFNENNYKIKFLFNFILKKKIAII